ncbi:MAG: hypothetical protein IJN92_10080 [Lachnospiraceae bacterium]|nr:hypothetical protein [Lachnospiraceae bacterium]
MITANNVIRVKNNKLQDEHMKSCPKSVHYEKWVAGNKKGTKSDEDGNIMFNIVLPSVIKSNSSGSSSSASAGDKENTEHRTSLQDMVIKLNAIAWEKQTFSKKKEIALANREKRPQTWEYKSNHDFIRLIFGISNDIGIKVGNHFGKLADICYRRDVFYQCEDFRQRFFMYATIDKISEYKEERKYQYITVNMPSDKSKNKATIRIPTVIFDVMIQGKEDIMEGTHRILAGYVHRSMFKNEDGTVTDWITMLKGVILYTAENGLYAEDGYTANLINRLCEKRVIFKRPYQPLENFGDTIPAVMIERLRSKHILIDTAASTREYNKKLNWSLDNPEYDCIILKPEDDIDIVFQMIDS